MSTPFDLSGRTAAITGGGRGLGLGISNALLEAGADVIVFGRSDIPPGLTAHAGSLGRQVHFVALDLADADAIAATAQRVLTNHQVDILVNNAGTQDRYPAVDFPLEAWDRSSTSTCARCSSSASCSAGRCWSEARARSSTSRRCSASRAGRPCPRTPRARAPSRS